jgi:hypothetical protein
MGNGICYGAQRLSSAARFFERKEGRFLTTESDHYAWVERALKCGFPERFAQQAESL